MPLDPRSGVYYELHGRGTPLLFGFPLFASHAQIFGSDQAPVLSRFLERFTDRYRVLLVDYPSIGKSRSIPPEEFTAERACDDMLSVATAAGFDRFAWLGYSVGAAIGLQLATRSDRLTALAIGGWTPIGGEYETMARAALVNVNDPPDYALAVLRNPEQYRQWSTFWGSLRDWQEASALPRIRCPCLAFAGADAVADGGGMIIPYAATLRARRAELEALGWQVRLLEGRDHNVGLDPDAIAPMVRAFFDSALPCDRSQQAG